MPESTTPLVRAHQLIVAAGAALEEAIDTPTTGVEAQVMAAARVLLDLRGKRAHVDAAWDVDVPRESWADPVQVRGLVYAMDLPEHITAREEARWWADLLGGGVTTSGALTSSFSELLVYGSYEGVPVAMKFILPRSEAVVQGSEVAA